MNPRNVYHCVGRIPDSDKIRFEFKENSNDENKNVFNGSISVRRSWKPKDDEYYPEDLIPFTAFGKTASYINNYVHHGDIVAAAGEIQISNNYTDKDGNMVYGKPFMLIDMGGMTVVHAKDGGSSKSSRSSSSSSTTAPEKKSGNPLLKHKKRSVL